MNFWELMNDIQQESMLNEALHIGDDDDAERWFNTGCEYIVQNILSKIDEAR